MTTIRFDEVARSERYFTSALLPHLLMSENFQGLKDLFESLEIQPDDKLNDFEVVAELDPLRDGSVYNERVRELFKEFKRLAVPDLFLRWGNSILIIEAKFFTNPNFYSIIKQVELQIDAIEKVRSQTQYNDNSKIKFMVLTVEPYEQKEIENSSFIVIFKTWDDIIKLFDNHSQPLSDDLQYTLKRLKESIQRAKEEFKKPKVTFEKINNFDELIQAIPRLISEGKIHVGFSGGLDRKSVV